MNKLIPRNALSTVFLIAVAFVILVQSLYDVGQLYHLYIIAYKDGGLTDNLISVGGTGIVFYLLVASTLLVWLGSYINGRGEFKNSKTALLLLSVCAVNSLVLIALIASPYADIVWR